MWKIPGMVALVLAASSGCDPSIFPSDPEPESDTGASDDTCESTEAAELEVEIGRDEPQLGRLLVPEGICANLERVPLVVSLHSWSSDYRQPRPTLEAEVLARGWYYLSPNFRGPNDDPEACGSELARGDILDAVDWAVANLPIDESQIFLTGASGGGHMALLMAATAPERWAAVSAWGSMTDLGAWYEFTDASDEHQRYARDIEACVGGDPSDESAPDFPLVQAEVFARSPLHQIAGAEGLDALPIDVSAGVRDGRGSNPVPFEQSIWAFNELETSEPDPVTPQEIAELAQNMMLTSPQESDVGLFGGLEIRLRRFSGASRLTIFDGDHSVTTVPGYADEVVAWFEAHPGPANPGPL